MKNLVSIGILGHGAVGLTLGNFIRKVNNPQVRVSIFLKNGDHLDNNNFRIIEKGKISLFPSDHFVALKREHLNIDILLVCLKSYSIKNIFESLLLFKLIKKTIIIPISNGIDIPNIIKSVSPKFNVIPSLLYISCQKDEDYFSIVNYSDSPKMILSKDKNILSDLDCQQMDVLLRFLKILNNAGIDAKFSDNYHYESWKKFIITSALNGSCVYLDLSLEEVLSRPDALSFLKGCLQECIKIAIHHVIDFKNVCVYDFIKEIKEMSLKCLPSMFVDLKKGNNTEILHLNGRFIEFGKELNIPTPFNDKICIKVNKIQLKNQKL